MAIVLDCIDEKYESSQKVLLDSFHVDIRNLVHIRGVLRVYPLSLRERKLFVFGRLLDTWALHSRVT